MTRIKEVCVRLRPWCSVLFTMIWLSNLAETDAYFSVYVLLAFLSFLLQLRPVKGVQEGRACGLILSAVFSGLVILANYPIFTTIGDPAVIGRSTSILMNLIDTLFSFAGGICTGYPLIHAFLHWAPERKKAYPVLEKKWLPWAVFGFLAFINLTHLFLVEYPGNVTEDPFTQIGEMVAGSYSNFNTFWHTMLLKGILSAGYGVFTDVNGAVACFCVFQVLTLCGAVTYSLVTMRDYGVSLPFLVAACLSFAVLPYHIALSVTIWKDVLFAAGTLLLLTALLRMLKDLDKKADMAVFLLGSLLFLVSRTSGWIIYLAAFLAVMAFYRKNRKLLALMGAMAVVGWAMLNPVLWILGVSDEDPVESLSVPIQQVSRVVAEGGALTEQERTLLSRVVDLDEVPQLYTQWLSDPMKVEARSKDKAYLLENMDQYRHLWFRLGLRYPGTYVEAWVEQTKGYWNAGYPYAMYSETVTDNPYGVEKTVSGNPVASMFRLYFGLSRHLIFFEPFHSIGLHVWLLILCLIRSIRRRREEGLLAVPLAMMVLGLWLGTPVYCCFRYVYPLFLCFPLVLGTTVFEKK